MSAGFSTSLSSSMSLPNRSAAVALAALSVLPSSSESLRLRLICGHEIGQMTGVILKYCSRTVSNLLTYLIVLFITKKLWTFF